MRLESMDNVHDAGRVVSPAKLDESDSSCA